ncbi:MAG: hypothetical protein IJR47_04905 [Clostridia bacterium]|nr:hypothetical protein [Clostridia bacterium]
MEIYNFEHKKIGTALYPLWRLKSKRIDGIVMLKNSFLQMKRLVPFTSVKKIEGNKIFLIKNYRTHTNGEHIEHGKALINGNGGYISRYLFDRKTGCVKSVEIAKSIYEDIQKKRKTYRDFSVKNGLIIINGEEGK